MHIYDYSHSFAWSFIFADAGQIYSCCFSAFLQLHVAERSEPDRGHIHTAWMSRLCAEAQTAGYQIRTQGATFPIHFLLFSTLFSITPPPPLPCFSLCLPLTPKPPLSKPPLLLFSLKTGVTRVSRLRNQCGWVCSDNRENFFYFIWVSHLCTSPIECEIGEAGRTEPAGGFSTQMTAIVRSLKNCVPVLLWLLANFQPFYRWCCKIQFSRFYREESLRPE